jgi:hypothetical protein
MADLGVCGVVAPKTTSRRRELLCADAG